MRFPLFGRTKRPLVRQLRRSRTLLHLEPLERREVPTVISPVFTEMQANQGRTHNATVSTPSVGVDQNGNFDVAFTENVSATQTEIVVRRFKADGTSQTANAAVVVQSAAFGAVGNPRIAVKGDGSFVVAYVAPSTSGGHKTIHIRRFTNTGTPNGSLVTVPTTDVNSKDQIEPSIGLIEASGAFYVSWTNVTGATTGDIRVRGFQADGAAIDPQDVAVTTGGMAHEPAIAARPNSSTNATAVIVSYTQDGAASAQNVFAVRLNTSVVVQGTAVQVNTTAGAANQSTVALDANLNAVVVWRDSTSAANQVIKMRRFNATGTPVTPAEEVVDNGPGNHSQPRVAKAGDDGRYVVAYTDAGGGTNHTSYAEFSAAGILQAVKHNFTSHTATQTNPCVGSSHNGIFGITADDSSTGRTEPWVRTFKAQPSAFFAVGGAPGTVQVRKVSDGSLAFTFKPFGATNIRVNVAWGDVNGDGIPDLIVAAGAGNPDVQVYDGKAFVNGTFNPANPAASKLADWFAYGVQFNIGANIAAGSVSGNGYADVITGASAGNPEVKVYRGKDIANNAFDPNGASLIAHWFAYGLQFNVGANVAAGDFTTSGFADVVTGATIGNPHLKIYNGQAIAGGTFNPDTSVRAQFFAYGLQFNVGAFVAVGDTTGEGHPDLITGASSGNPHVKVYSGAAIANGTFNQANPDANLRNQFFAYDLQFNIGSAVAAADIEGNGKLDIITGAAGGNPHYRVVKGNAGGTKPPAVKNIDGIPSDLQGAVSVGGL
jgi:hypothetical protein